MRCDNHQATCGMRNMNSNISWSKVRDNQAIKEGKS